MFHKTAKKNPFTAPLTHVSICFFSDQNGNSIIMWRKLPVLILKLTPERNRDIPGGCRYGDVPLVSEFFDQKGTQSSRGENIRR